MPATIVRNNPVLILDNGANSIKAGYAHEPVDSVRVIPNSIANSKLLKRTFIADELEKNCKDYEALTSRNAFEKVGLAYSVWWSVEKGDAYSTMVFFLLGHLDELGY